MQYWKNIKNDNTIDYLTLREEYEEYEWDKW